jgi:hypothetical protein
MERYLTRIIKIFWGFVMSHAASAGSRAEVYFDDFWMM